MKFILKSSDNKTSVSFNRNTINNSKLLNNTVQAWIIVQEENEKDKNLVANSYYQSWLRKDKEVSPVLKDLSNKLENAIPFTDKDISFLRNVLVDIERAKRLNSDEIRRSSYYTDSPENKEIRKREELEHRRKLAEERELKRQQEVRDFFVKEKNVEPKELNGSELSEVLSNKEQSMGKIISFFRKKK